jgi:hypothetical protein
MARGVARVRRGSKWWAHQPHSWRSRKKAHIESTQQPGFGFRREGKATTTFDVCSGTSQIADVRVLDEFMLCPRPMHGQATGVEQGEAVLEEAVTASREALGARFLAAYALGSLAHGGFSPLVSDVDLGLVLADPVTTTDDETIQSVADTIKARGSTLRERLSVFWGTPSTLQGQLPGGRFPALDRLDLLENGRLLEGQDAPKGLVRPSHTELLVEGAEFALGYLGGGSLGPPSPGLGSMRPADNTVL